MDIHQNDLNVISLERGDFKLSIGGLNNNMLLLTNCEVHTGEYLDCSFEVWTGKLRSKYFPIWTELIGQ